MRPYLAVLKDSFREALVSRVLWILLLVSTLVLLAIAPVGITEQAGSHIGWSDLRQPRELAVTLVSQSGASEDSPGKRVWELLGGELQQRLKDLQDPVKAARAGRRTIANLRDELNELLERRDLYQEKSWRKVELDEEAQDLLAGGLDALPDDRLARFNRLALEAAFPAQIAASKQTNLQFSYLYFEFGSPLPLERELVIQTAVMAFINLFVGFVGVFSGILVTAQIVPQTFEPGAIDLLLSKPISRVLLFVTKFFGGCAFILLNGLYFVGGLWLIVGLRHGDWNTKLLLCIPVFMFLFSIYYAVSALAGVVWRSAIISVVITVLFWGACFTVGTAKGVVEEVFLSQNRLKKIIPAGESMFAIQETGTVVRFSGAERTWKPVFAGDTAGRRQGPFNFAPPLIGPVYDQAGKRLLATNSTMGRFGFLAGGSRLFVATEDEDWKRQEGIPAPNSPLAIWLDDEDQVFVAAADGVFRLEGDPLDVQEAVNVLGFDIPLGPSGGRFEKAGAAWDITPNASVAVNPSTLDIATFDRSRLAVHSLDTETGRYAPGKQTKLDIEEQGLLAAGGSRILLALEDGTVQFHDAASLRQTGQFSPGRENPPRFVAVSDDGRWLAVVFHHRRLWLYDAVEGQDFSSRIGGQGDISAIRFNGKDRLLVVDRLQRVTEYDLGDLSVVRRIAPSMETLETVYRYIIRPLYTVFPKPGELDNLVTYILSGEETAAVGDRQSDLGAARIKLNIWEPVWSNLAFLAFVLGIGSLYVYRKDF